MEVEPHRNNESGGRRAGARRPPGFYLCKAAIPRRVRVAPVGGTWPQRSRLVLWRVDRSIRRLTRLPAASGPPHDQAADDRLTPPGGGGGASCFLVGCGGWWGEGGPTVRRRHCTTGPPSSRVAANT